MIDEKFMIFDYRDYSTIYDRDIALTSIMIFPNSPAKRKSYIFRATILKHEELSAESNGAEDNALFDKFKLMIKQAGSWQWLAEHEEKAETQSLANMFTSRFIRGHIAAQMLLLMINKGISIFDAAKYYLHVMQSSDDRLQEYIGTVSRYKEKMSETDLSGNIWNEFKNVSPLFIPTALAKNNISRPFIEFDNFETKKLNAAYVTRDGFPGFCELARRYREIATKRNILDENTVWKNTVPPEC